MTNWISFVSLTYKLAAINLMVGEANFISKEIALNEPEKIRMEVLVSARVRPPRFGFGGTIETSNYVYSFPGNGKLSFIHRKGPEAEPDQSYKEKLAAQRSLIDTNGAYLLATQWLGAIRADLKSLARLPLTIEQEYFFKEPVPLQEIETTKQSKIYLPIFNVYWGGAAEGPVNIRILGTHKQLLSIRFEDASFLLRPPLILTNAADLLTQLEITTNKFELKRRVERP